MKVGLAQPETAETSNRLNFGLILPSASLALPLTQRIGGPIYYSPNQQTQPHISPTFLGGLILLYPLVLPYPLFLIPIDKFPIPVPTTSTSSVDGTIYGCTLFRTIVRCSKAYAKPMREASLQAGPMKEMPKLLYLFSTRTFYLYFSRFVGLLTEC